MAPKGGLERLEREEAIERFARDPVNTLLCGAAGTGKSTLAERLAAAAAQAGNAVQCIGADPGTPAFGVPGAVSLGEWTEGGWRALAMIPLCSLDAGRFRLPLAGAVRELAADAGDAPLIVDGPGMVRGASGAETLSALTGAATIGRVILLTRQLEDPPLAAELAALDTEVWVLRASDAAQRPGKRRRDRSRTRDWDAYLAEARNLKVDIREVPVLGTPPPGSAPHAWVGRQAGLLAGMTWAMGEVAAFDGDRLTLRCREPSGPVTGIVVRDAQRDDRGLLVTTRPFARGTTRWAPPGDIAPAGGARGPRPVARVGPVTATLVNGVFGDPLLHLRFRHRRRSLLFDLGEATRLPAKIAHQVTDVFISHAHADHIGGFVSFLRSRIGEYEACRLHGPPGLADNVAGFVRGIHWDRAGSRAPRFLVAELHGDRLLRYRVIAGIPDPDPLDEPNAHGGLLLDEPEFRVRAAVLDHGIPVLAFALEPELQVNVRPDRLEASRLEPGPWLTELKRRIARGDAGATIDLPDGSRRPANELADDLLMIAPGEKLAYATDLADTRQNRERLTALARGAHTFFCESPFLEQDADQARRTGHLTARACGEIATSAEVERLVPFHFSARYEDEPERVYREVSDACAQTVVPGALDL